MTSPASLLGASLTLPSGASLKNRILKSAMSEAMAPPTGAPTELHETLYGTWASGGVGVQITGNVMVDPKALGEPGNVVVEDERHLEALRRWAKAGTRNGTALWMQINHPGKQAPRFLNEETVAPSAVGFGPKLSPAFSVPRPLTEAEIEALIERFATTARVAKLAGFSGVQIHGAHGYLVAQFLSPKHNVREDRWGGSLENRARFVLSIYRAMRREVGPDFPVSIKLNSADFQRGGFEEGESLQVMRWLEEAGIDLIEVSGGTYEAPAMTGPKKASTKAREGYFLDFVERAKKELKVPLAVTGGFRTPSGMAQALEAGVDMVGLARTLAVQPDFPAQVLAGDEVASKVRKPGTGIELIDTMTMMDVTWYENQLHRMAKGKAPQPGLSGWRSALRTVRRMGTGAFKARRAR